MNFLARIGNASATIILSFILATISMALIFIYFDQFFEQLLNWGRAVEGVLISDRLPRRIRNFMDLLVDNFTIVYVMFTVVSRIIIAIFLTLLGALFNRQ